MSWEVVPLGAVATMQRAIELTTDARTARKFLRSVTPADEQPGKGSRWAIEKRDIRSLKSKFAKFVAAETERKVKATEPATDEPEGDELEMEPTAEELAAIDAE